MLANSKEEMAKGEKLFEEARHAAEKTTNQINFVWYLTWKDVEKEASFDAECLAYLRMLVGEVEVKKAEYVDTSPEKKIQLIHEVTDEETKPEQLIKTVGEYLGYTITGTKAKLEE